MDKKMNAMIKLITLGIIIFCFLVFGMFESFRKLNPLYEEKETYVNQIKVTYPYFNYKQDNYIEEYIQTLDNNKTDEVKYVVNYLDDKINLLFKLYRNEYIVDYFSLFFDNDGNLVPLSNVIINDDEFNKHMRAYLDKHYNISDSELASGHKSYLFKDRLVEIYLTNYNDEGNIALIKLEYEAIKDYINIYFEISDDEKEITTRPSTTTTTTTKPANVLPIIPENKKVIALTFDDGPSKYTTELLNILDEYNAKATFFMVGYNMKKNPQIVLDVVNRGHEVGNHTLDHSRLTKLKNKSLVVSKVDDNNKIFNDITGLNMELLRPPYGSYDKKVKEYLEIPFILWSVDSRDWESRNADKIIKEVLIDLKDGDIVLFHDLYPTTIEAIRRLLPVLSADNYEFVTVTDLFAHNNISLTARETYTRVK